MAWQSQFHGGTGVDHAQVQGRALFFAAKSAAMSLMQRLRRTNLWRLLAREVQGRSSDDITPLALSDLPADIRPLVDAVNQLMARTQDLVAHQRQFLDNASHQLRTHLTTLQMQIDYARSEGDSTQVQHALAAIGREIARATRSTLHVATAGTGPQRHGGGRADRV